MLDDLAHSKSLCDFGNYKCFKVKEVRCVINRMNMTTMIGPDAIWMEFWKSADMTSMEWLIRLFNIIFKTTHICDK